MTTLWNVTEYKSDSRGTSMKSVRGSTRIEAESQRQAIDQYILERKLPRDRWTYHTLKPGSQWERPPELRAIRGSRILIARATL